MRVAVAYFPSRNEVFAVYDSPEEAKREVKYLNCFSQGGEKLQAGWAEMTEEELKQFRE
ncbi:MAG: hypothetical protein IKP66_04595 [Lachnospiraceae bacterium]|nr:hypothetical protein [Lachnospiraceae bacterium]